MKKKQHKTGCAVALAAVLLLAAAGAVFSHFGGFGAGKSADREAFKKYAKAVADLSVPEETKIVALGEATHGNREFQALKLEVFQVLVERYGVRQAPTLVLVNGGDYEKFRGVSDIKGWLMHKN